jgi:hypothetical protein
MVRNGDGAMLTDGIRTESNARESSRLIRAIHDRVCEHHRATNLVCASLPNEDSKSPMSIDIPQLANLFGHNIRNGP